MSEIISTGHTKEGFKDLIQKFNVPKKKDPNIYGRSKKTEKKKQAEKNSKEPKKPKKPEKI